MKMTKLLASGVAASLAATSLAAIGASAEEKTFDMGYSKASFGATASVTGKIADTIGKSADQATMQTVVVTAMNYAQFRINPDDNKEMVLAVSDASGDTDFYYQYVQANGELKKGYTKNLANADLQAAIGHTALVVDPANPVTALGQPNPLEVNLGDNWWEGATMTIEGYKYDDKGNKTKVVDTLKMKSAWMGNAAYGDPVFTITVLSKDEPVYKEWEFAPHYYDEIEKVSMKYNYRMDTDNSSVYTILNNFKGDIQVNLGDVAIYNGGMNLDGAPTGALAATYSDNITVNKAQLAAQQGNNYAAALIAYAVTHCGYSPSYDMFLGDKVGISSIDMYKNYDILQFTSTADIIDRWHVDVLSRTGAWNSASNSGVDGNQSYNNGDMTQGDSPNGFAGFASQVANFFNKQTNGEITFTFTTVTADGGNAWVVGGIPSTEVGLKKVLDGATEQDFALFFNYGTTGGVMLSAVKVDGASGSVTFDISDYLDTCDGLTAATLNNIYYGLTKKASLAYGTKDEEIGLKVETVTLSYGEDEGDGDIEEDDDTDDTDDTDDEDDDDTSDDVDDDDDTDDTDDDDDDDTGITIDDDDDDDDDDNNDTQGAVVTPGNNEEPDGNPNTGVALAVVPAMVAAAAVVVSKKRK